MQKPDEPGSFPAPEATIQTKADSIVVLTSGDVTDADVEYGTRRIVTLIDKFAEPILSPNCD